MLRKQLNGDHGNQGPNMRPKLIREILPIGTVESSLGDHQKSFISKIASLSHVEIVL